MSFTITTSRRSRAGSESSITSSISSGSSVCSCSSSSATATATTKYSLVAADCSTHFPRRVASDADLVNKPILRRQNSGILKHSPSSPALSIAQKPKRISFSSESLCLFNNEESPRQVGAGSVYAKPITQPHTPSSLADLVLVADPSEDNDIPSWAVISSTTPSPIAPILSLLKSSPIAFESVRIVTPTNPTPSSTISDSITLHLTALVQNLHFEKQISAVFTSNSWKSSSASPLATYVNSIHPPSPEYPSIDRFRIELVCDASNGAPVVGSRDRIVNLEFALKCVMGGIESWDNRGGMNHLVMIKSSYGNGTPLGSPSTSTGTLKKSPSALDLESEVMRKRRASQVALKVAAVIADEAKKIDAEFSRDRRKSLEMESIYENATSHISPPSRSASTIFAPIPTTASATPSKLIAVDTLPIAPSPIRPSTASFSSSRSVTPTPTNPTPPQPVIPTDDRFEELNEKELAYATKIATPASPLMTIRPLKKVGSMANLSLAEPIGLNRPASPNPIYTPTPSRPGSPSHTVAQQRPLTTSDIFRPQSPLAVQPPVTVKPVAVRPGVQQSGVAVDSTGSTTVTATKAASPSRIAVLNASATRRGGGAASGLSVRLEEGEYAPLYPVNVSSLYASGFSGVGGGYSANWVE
ncbi:hypothetical protein HDU79_000275 [Rhizoclosmatium sp. JEL0117]|nr:hypothetical protein HDU79_000275 [Rhizoclosmatium sp. JEL0117]